MLDWIRIPYGGGSADITFAVIGLLLIVGAMFGHRHFERKDAEQYERRRRESE